MPHFYEIKINNEYYIINYSKYKDSTPNQIAIHNSNYLKKRLKIYSQILENWNPKVEIDFKLILERYFENYGLIYYDDISQNIINFFKIIVSFHKPEVDLTWNNGNFREEIINNCHYVKRWYDISNEDFRINKNEFIQKLNILYHTINIDDFLKLRDCIGFSTSAIINELTKDNFYLGNTPFKDEIFGIQDLLNDQYSIDKINLKKNIGKNKKPVSTDKSEDETKDVERSLYYQKTITKIKEVFNAIDNNKKWGYTFKKLEDYNKYCHLLALYFLNEDYELPKEAIIIKDGSKVRTAIELGALHREFIEYSLTMEDIKYFNLVRVLRSFKNQTNKQILKNLRRKF